MQFRKPGGRNPGPAAYYVAVKTRKPTPVQKAYGAPDVQRKAVGKTTRVQKVYGGMPAVQRSSTQRADAPSSADVSEAAKDGLSGATAAMPHADTIQRSFGRHDVTEVKSHVGGAAARASDKMGAQAYASGDSVAFKSPPDLHTAAHEAAHVIQQRG
jgi:hypothetical protein